MSSVYALVKSLKSGLCAPKAVYLTLAAALSLWSSAAMADDAIHFTTEEYPPYNFEENGVYKGVGYDQIIIIMKEIGTPYTVELMPWARAYAMAQSDSPTCVFTAAHTPERDSLFKWVEPLGHDRNIMTSKIGSGVHAENVEQALKYRVGTQRDDYTETVLQKDGFKNVELASSLDLTLKKLLIGRIDMIPLSERFFYDLVEKGNPLKQQFILTEQIFALACSKSVPDAVIAKMQAHLDAMIADGRQKAIFKQYGMRGY